MTNGLFANRRFRPAYLLSLAVIVLAAAAPVGAQKGEEYIERFSARVFSMTLNEAQTSGLQIAITRWTTPEERDALLATLVEQGSEAFYEALQNSDDLGFMRLDRGRSTLRYAWSVIGEDGKRRVVLATDRHLGYGEVINRDRTLRYNVTMAMFELNDKGRGEGNLALGVEVTFDEPTRSLSLKHYASQPLRVTNVRSQLPKKKKE
jgi:hypothetical protein